MAFLSADGIKAAIGDERRRFDLDFLLYGLQRNWIRIRTVEELLLAGRVRHSTEDVVVSVSLAMDEGRDAVLSAIRSVVGGGEGDEKRNVAIREAWWGLLIQDVLHSDDDAGALLTRVSALWADVGYPPEWESFIHYLPAPVSFPKGTEAVLAMARQASSAWLEVLDGTA